MAASSTVLKNELFLHKPKLIMEFCTLIFILLYKLKDYRTTFSHNCHYTLIRKYTVVSVIQD